MNVGTCACDAPRITWPLNVTVFAKLRLYHVIKEAFSNSFTIKTVFKRDLFPLTKNVPWVKTVSQTELRKDKFTLLSLHDEYIKVKLIKIVLRNMCAYLCTCACACMCTCACSYACTCKFKCTCTCSRTCTFTSAYFISGKKKLYHSLLPYQPSLRYFHQNLFWRLSADWKCDNQVERSL